MAEAFRVIEVSASSSDGFEAAIQAALEAVDEKIRRTVTGIWVKEQRVEVNNGKIAGYQVNVLITLTTEGKPLML